MKRVKKTALGAAAALAVYVALLACISALMVRGSVEGSQLTVFVWAFACLASFVGCKLGSAGEGESVVSAALCAAAFWLLVQLLGFLACDALEPSRSAALLLPVFAGAALSCLLKRGKKKRRSEKGKRRGHK